MLCFFMAIHSIFVVFASFPQHFVSISGSSTKNCSVFPCQLNTQKTFKASLENSNCQANIKGWFLSHFSHLLQAQDVEKIWFQNFWVPEATAAMHCTINYNKSNSNSKITPPCHSQKKIWALLEHWDWQWPQIHLIKNAPNQAWLGKKPSWFEKQNSTTPKAKFF